MEHKKRGETLKVEVIKAQENNKNLANPRKIERMRVAAYCRVSTDDEDQIKSYDSMVRYYTDMIKNNKDWVYAGVYADKAMTGTKDNREQFQKLIQDCKDGKIDMVLAKSLPRFARNTLDTLKYVRMLRERNIAVYFEVEKNQYLERWRVFNDDFEFCCTAGSGEYFRICEKGLENENAERGVGWLPGMHWI